MMQVRMQIEANGQFQHLGSALKGHTDKWWTKFLSNMRNPTSNPFKDKVLVIIEDVMGENAYKDQYDYPEETKISEDTSISECLY